ncbi:MAG: PAS domain-containing protein [Polyangia bacterium]
MQDLHTRFFQFAAELLATADTRGYLCELSPAWVTTLGFSFDELRSQPLLDFVHPDDRAATQRATERLLDKEVPAHFENRCLCKDGSYKRLRWLSRFSRQAGLILACARPVTSLVGAAELEPCAGEVESQVARTEPPARHEVDRLFARDLRSKP